TNSADLLVGTNALILKNTKHLEIQAANDSTTTGTNATLAAFAAGVIRLTNASLTSLANIPSGEDGQELVLINRTGGSVQIADDSEALGTVARRIHTGNSSGIALANNAAIMLRYDNTTI